MLDGLTSDAALSGLDYRTDEKRDYSIESATKWGEALDGGFQIVPDLLLRWQTTLNLTANDVVVALNLMMAWWNADRAPFPRVSTIAKRMGASERTVQRSLHHLRVLGLLKRTMVKGTDGKEYQAFDLMPLAARLRNIATTDRLTVRRRELRSGTDGFQNRAGLEGQ